MKWADAEKLSRTIGDKADDAAKAKNRVAGILKTYYGAWQMDFYWQKNWSLKKKQLGFV